MRRAARVVLLVTTMLAMQAPAFANPSPTQEYTDVGSLIGMSASEATQTDAAPPAAAPVKAGSDLFNGKSRPVAVNPTTSGPIKPSDFIDLDPALQRFPRAVAPKAPENYRGWDGKTGSPDMDERSDPAAVADWWGTLSKAEQDGLIQRYPEWIGGLSGVAIEARDRANRLALSREIAKARKDLALAEAAAAAARDLTAVVMKQPPLSQTVVSALLAQNEASQRLHEAKKRLFGAMNLQKQLAEVVDPTKLVARKDVYLIDFDAKFAGGDGGAAISFGDPTKAKNVGVIVPGITNELKRVDDPMTSAANLRRQVFDEFGTKGLEESATIAWLGYDTPELDASAPIPYKARVGAVRLKEFVGDLRATGKGEQARITVFRAQLWQYYNRLGIKHRDGCRRDRATRQPRRRGESRGSNASRIGTSVGGSNRQRHHRTGSLWCRFGGRPHGATVRSAGCPFGPSARSRGT